MAQKKGNNKSGIDVNNEAERINVEIDRLITNPKDRETLKDFFKSNYLLTQFFFRSETDRDIDIEDRVIGIVMDKMQGIYLADNASLCKNVAEVVEKQLAESLAAWNVRLGGIETSLKDLKAGQDDISLKIDQIAERVESLETFEEKALKEIDYLKKAQGWRTITVRIALAVTISTIITLFALLMHKNRTEKPDKAKTQIENIIR